MAFDPEVLTGSENAEGETDFQDITKKMHVKFQLKKECIYGEEFLLVGDDPALGSWNPSNGVPLTWSDGHKWTVEMDLPVGLSIQFKFVLKTSTGNIIWQPGPDRIFRAWETKDTIIIAEDWANAEFQKIIEDQMIDENADKGLDLLSGPARLNGELTDHVYLDAMLSDTEEGVTLQDFVRSADDESISEKELGSLANENPRIVEDEETSFTSEEGPLLVPGLNPLPVMSSEETISKEFRKPINADD